MWTHYTDAYMHGTVRVWHATFAVAFTVGGFGGLEHPPVLPDNHETNSSLTIIRYWPLLMRGSGIIITIMLGLEELGL